MSTYLHRTRKNVIYFIILLSNSGCIGTMLINSTAYTTYPFDGDTTLLARAMDYGGIIKIRTSDGKTFLDTYQNEDGQYMGIPTSSKRREQVLEPSAIDWVKFEDRSKTKNVHAFGWTIRITGIAALTETIGIVAVPLHIPMLLFEAQPFTKYQLDDQAGLDQKLERSLNHTGKVRITTYEENRYVFKSIKQDSSGQYLGVTRQALVPIDIDLVKELELEDQSGSKGLNLLGGIVTSMAVLAIVIPLFAYTL